MEWKNSKVLGVLALGVICGTATGARQPAKITNLCENQSCLRHTGMAFTCMANIAVECDTAEDEIAYYCTLTFC